MHKEIDFFEHWRVSIFPEAESRCIPYFRFCRDFSNLSICLLRVLSYRFDTEPNEAPVLESESIMNVVAYSASALSVALLFYGWRFYRERMQGQQKKLRERVTYMLWVMANDVPNCQ